MRFAELDAVTFDAYGTLVELTDPVPALAEALRGRGIERSRGEIAAAFAAEATYYKPRSARGGDEASLAELRRECAAVFLEALGAELDPAEFAAAFVGALRFEAVPGAARFLGGLRARGLELAVISNWDVSLAERLGEAGLGGFFSATVSSAEAGSEKPEPGIFHAALARIGVEPGRALHLGNEPADVDGARAAGLRFAPAPLATALEGWT